MEIGSSAFIRVSLLLGMAVCGDMPGNAQESGSIVTWGLNDFGQCDVPALNEDFIAVSGGYYHSLGLKSDGTIVAWGKNNYGQIDVPTPNLGFLAVSGGYYHSLGLKSDGTIVAWGKNDQNQCIIPTPNMDFLGVEAGGHHSLGLKSDGTIVAWGLNDRGQCDVPTPNADFVAVGAGEYFSIGLKSNGVILAWGGNAYGQCDVPSPNVDFVAIKAGAYHCLGIKSNGTIVAWGAGGLGQSGGLHYGQSIVPLPNENFVAVAGGFSHSLGLKSDGSIITWGRNIENQCNVPMPNENFCAIAAGFGHSLSIRIIREPVISYPLVLISHGTFAMGSPLSEPMRGTNEAQHQVILTQSFYMSQFEVTEQLWDSVMGSGSSASQLPQADVSWDEAVAFCNALSIADGLTPSYEINGPSGDVTWNAAANGYRLPTEAEWEYACRATTTGAFNNDTDCLLTGTDANCGAAMPGCPAGIAPGARTLVGTFPPNQWGLYDMHGNVWEWCWDGYRDDYENLPQQDPVYNVGPGYQRVLRGGCYNWASQSCRSAFRYPYGPGSENGSGGFRIVKSGLLNPIISDVSGDQGGFLDLSWPAFSSDIAGSSDSVVTYEAQRNEQGSWVTLETIVAAHADTYQVTVETDDILIVGQPEPFSKYRVVANSSAPGVQFYSAVDSAYSIDNLVPPKPAAVLYDDPMTRIIVWPVPSIPDLASMCVYRGTEPGFTPDVPVECPSLGQFMETHLAYYFYRVQFSDIHGNLSEFSDELHGQWPTGADLPMPVAFSLAQNVPNPFNPITTISFEIPRQRRVSLRIYDVSGRLVRALLDGEIIAEGRHEAVWNGRDDTGKQVAAGVYFYRLEAGEFRETKRMVLVK